MSSKMITLIEDDLDGTQATETVRFAIDGVEYEIDLSDRNANRLRNSLSDFISHGRKVGGRRGRRSVAVDGVDNKAVRAWAKSAGVAISSRGRISADVVEQYRRAGH
jgi:Lsr2